MMPWGTVRLAIGRIWFAMAVVSGAVHAATYFGIDPMTWCPSLWRIHDVAFFAGSLTLFLPGNLRFLPRGTSVLDHLEPKLPAGGAANVDDADLVRMMRPSVRKLIAGGLAAYAVVTFFVCLGILHGGQPGQRDGQYVLVAHGKIIQTLTESQYRWDLAVQTRFATGYWMFAFYVLGALWSKRRLRPSTPGEPALSKGLAA